MPTPKTITAKIVVPEWAEWRATDKDGLTCVFSHSPIMILGVWYKELANHKCEAVCTTTPPRNWRKTLRRVK